MNIDRNQHPYIKLNVNIYINMGLTRYVPKLLYIIVLYYLISVAGVKNVFNILMQILPRWRLRYNRVINYMPPFYDGIFSNHYLDWNHILNDITL